MTGGKEVREAMDAAEPARSVVVTGAAEGIGRAVVEELVRSSDAAIVGVDRQRDPLEELGSRYPDRLRTLVGDVSEWETHVGAADLAETLAPLEWWVNNAGTDTPGLAHEVSPADIEAGLHTNQLGPMYGTAVALRRMVPLGRGSIVNISSIHAFAAFPGYFAYQAAKAAIVMFTKGVAADYGPKNIRCNAVCPGTIATPMLERGLSADPDQRARQMALEEQLSPLGRIGTAAEVAKAVSFLLSDDASFITGTALVVDGGATSRCAIYPSPFATNEELRLP